MLHRILLAITAGSLLAGTASGGTATLNSFQSTALSRTMTYWVYLPANYETKKAAGEKFSVVYLLHWYQYSAQGWHDCTFDNCARANPDLDATIDNVQNVIGIAPQDEGGGGVRGISWWINSSFCGNVGDFLTTDLVAEVNSKYATYGDAAHTGVVGASMGGFGALHYIRVAKSVFSRGYGVVPLTDFTLYSRPWTCNGSSGTTSGGCGQWHLCAVLGSDYWSNTTVNTQYSPLANVQDYSGVRFGFSSSSGDFFKGDCESFHAALTTAGIDHGFVVYPNECHEYPNASRMTEILKFLFEDGPAPGTSAVKEPSIHASRSIVGKARPEVVVCTVGIPTRGVMVGLDGRSLRTMPRSGVVLTTK